MAFPKDYQSVSLVPTEQYASARFEMIKATVESGEFTYTAIPAFLQNVSWMLHCGCEEQLKSYLDQTIEERIEGSRDTYPLSSEKPADGALLVNSQTGFIVLGLNALPQEHGFTSMLRFYNKTGSVNRDDVAVAYGLASVMQMGKANGSGDWGRKLAETSTPTDPGLRLKLIDALTLNTHGSWRDEIMQRAGIYGRWNRLAGNRPEQIIASLLSEFPVRQYRGAFLSVYPGDSVSRRVYNSDIYLYGLLAQSTPEANGVIAGYHQKLLAFPFNSENERMMFLQKFYEALGEGMLELKHQKHVHYEVRDEEMQSFLQGFLDHSPQITWLQSLLAQGEQTEAEAVIAQLKANGFSYDMTLEEGKLSVNTNNKLVKLLLWDRETEEFFRQRVGVVDPVFYGESTNFGITYVLMMGTDIQNFQVPEIWSDKNPPKAIYLGFAPVKGCLTLYTMRPDGAHDKLVAEALREYLGISEFDESHVDRYDRSNLYNRVNIVYLKTRFLKEFEIVDH